MADTLDRLRHHTIVRCDDKNYEISQVGPAGSHLTKRRVAGCVDKGDRLIVVTHLIGRDVLSNASCLSPGNVRRANAVHQRRLAVIDVPQHGDNRWTRHRFNPKFFRGLLESRLENVLNGFGLHDINLDAQLEANLQAQVLVYRVVERQHLASAKQRSQHLLGGPADLFAEIADQQREGDRGDRLARPRRAASLPPHAGPCRQRTIVVVVAAAATPLLAALTHVVECQSAATPLGATGLVVSLGPLVFFLLAADEVGELGPLEDLAGNADVRLLGRAVC